MWVRFLPVGPSNREKMDIKNFVKVYNLIPQDVCEKIISDYENDLRWEKHVWFANIPDISPLLSQLSQRHEKELETLYDQKLISLGAYFEEALTKYYVDINSYGLITFFDAPRLNKYSTGTKMLTHVDLIRRNKEDGVPVLSFIGVLNDDYDGGKFLMNKEVLELKQGDILMFPSTFLYEHEVTEVIKGTRYSVVSWGY
jgi:hypothetical protein